MLDKCLEICRAAKLSRERSKKIEKTDKVYAVKTGPSGKFGNRNNREVSERFNNFKQMQKGSGINRKCKYCGGMHEYNKQKCPAYGKICRKCQKQNHFAAVCRSKKPARINNIEYLSYSSDYDEINMVSKDEEKSNTKQLGTKSFSKRLYAIITIGNQPVNFQLDSGATCNVISLPTLQRCLGKVNLENTTRVLGMYNCATVEPIGQCTLNLKNEKTGQIYETEFVVLRDECTPLLGSETNQQMDLVKVQYENILSLSVKGTAVLLNKDTIIQQYPDVFQGTGKFENKYHLTVDPDAVPVIHPPRPIPIALRNEWKEELDRLHSEGILTEVTEPTPWVSTMVIARKSSGKLHICIDPKELNQVMSPNIAACRSRKRSITPKRSFKRSGPFIQ